VRADQAFLLGAMTPCALALIVILLMLWAEKRR